VIEADWPADTDPGPMLNFLRGKAIATERKLRLFAVACCRRADGLMSDKSRRAMEVAEQYADGAAADADLQNAYDAAYSAWRAGREFAAHCVAGAVRAACMGSPDPARYAEVSRSIGVDTAAGYAATNSAEAVAFAKAGDALDRLAVVRTHYLLKIENRREFRSVGFYVYQVDDPGWATAVASERCVQSRLLGDIFGNPFRARGPAADPVWHDCPGGTVRELARVAYEERRLPEGTLEPARLAMLADALEDAGCADADLLGHLRGPGLHCRGCWAVDLLLGRK
jgi:hypothetical protein